MMKKFIILVCVGVSTFVFGQQTKENDSLVLPILPLNKQKALKDFEVNAYMRFGLDSDVSENKYSNSQFNGNDFRLEIRGKVHDKVSFRFRNKYMTESRVGTLDNVNTTIDLALIDIQATPKVNITLGKLAADWGGYEYDLNAIEVLSYTDILTYAENYLVGAGVAYQLNAKHRFSFQALNASADKLEDLLNAPVPEEIKKAKFPIAFVGNWRGSFWEDKFQTDYSYSYVNQAQHKTMHYIALGNKYQHNQFTWMYDFQYSRDGLDQRGIVSNMFAGDEPKVAENATYIEHWTRVDYEVFSKLYFSLSLMTGNAYGKDNTNTAGETRHLRTSYGAIPMIQYMPFKKFNLRFYAAYVGRWYAPSNYAKEQLGQENYNTGRFSIGFIAPLKLL